MLRDQYHLYDRFLDNAYEDKDQSEIEFLPVQLLV
jgi:hypothetical protein